MFFGNGNVLSPTVVVDQISFIELKNQTDKFRKLGTYHYRRPLVKILFFILEVLITYERIFVWSRGSDLDKNWFVTKTTRAYQYKWWWGFIQGRQTETEDISGNLKCGRRIKKPDMLKRKSEHFSLVVLWSATLEYGFDSIEVTLSGIF